jgi:hypothetical protein
MGTYDLRRNQKHRPLPDYTKEADALIPEARALAEVSRNWVSAHPFSHLNTLHIGGEAQGSRRQTSRT